MSMLLKVNTAVVVPVNIAPLIDDTDFKTQETAVAYNASGLALKWNFVTTAGVVSQTAVTPTDTGGDYDWTHSGGGMYKIEIPASAGASINNNAAGYGWFSGVATGVLSWVGPVITFAPDHVVDGLVAGTDKLQVDVTQLLGTAWLTPGTAGTPDVNVKLWNSLTTVALPLVPTTAGRTLDVSAGGEAGIDWANVGSPTTSLALTGTTIATTQKVDVETIKTNPVVNGGTLTFPTNSTLASTTNITAGTITTVTTVTNGVIVTTNEDKTGYSLTQAFPTNFAALAINVSGHVSRVTLVDTTSVNTDMRGTDGAYTGTPPTATENADALLKRDMSAVTGEAARSPLNAFRFLRNLWTVVGTTLTVKKEDDTTTAWTATVTTNASADPITGSDPA